MAVPSDRKRRPFLLSLSLFLLLSALLVLLFLFLGSSTQSLPFLPARLSTPTPSLLGPLPHQQQSPTPTPIPNPIPTPGSSSDSQQNSPASAVAEAAEKADASRPEPTAAVTGGASKSSVSPRPADSSDAAAVDADVKADRAVDAAGGGDGDGDDLAVADVRWETCKVMRGVSPADYIPCLDNIRAIKALRSRRHMEHRERHCPVAPRPRCLVRTPAGYRLPVPWPHSRDMIWYNNVPHPKLVEYKKDQNWVTKSGDYLVFPGGGTQFKDGVTRYIQFIEQIMPAIQWGTHTRTVLDVGCGVASFGGYLLDRNVITMSFAPKDEHEAQIQFALERGIPALLAVIGTQKLPFPDNAFDVVHCARCRVHWYANGGKPLLELNRVLRPGGYFIWSATPVYRKEKRDQDDWNAMVTLTKSICWRTFVKSDDSNGIGVVIYQKATSSSCYLERKTNEPPLCSKKDGSRFPWYALLDSCILPPAVSNSDETKNLSFSWPGRLTRYASVPNDSATTKKFDADTKYWKQVISEVYFNDFPVNWSSIRNVMDMNAGYGGFAAAIVDQPLWVMNVIPIGQSDTLPVIFSRGLIGVYHDWCESFNTYPRTYDLLHMSYLLGSLTNRCDIIEVAAEVDRILRPGRWFVLKDTMDMIKKIGPILRSLHYETVIVKHQYLVATKSFWRPGSKVSRSG